MSSEDRQRWYLRFPTPYRIEHWIFMVDFTTLAITGLIQKYAAASWAKAIMGLLGGIENTRFIHHTAAIIMMLEVVYHLGAIAFRLYVKRYRPSMLPTLNDVSVAFNSFLYNLGLRKNRPQQGRYTFEEKMEYWAVVWGTIVMVLTGFMMWNPIATTRFLPGEAIPAAKTAHGSEALLAVLAIILWHMYHVLVRRFNPSMFTGKIPADEMLEEHPLELADIKAGVAQRPLDSKSTSKRSRVFGPVYGVFAVVLLFGIYRFVTLEQTAVAAYPPAETVVVYSPLTPTPLPTLPPTPTQAPALAGQANASTTWEGGIGKIFQDNCSGCHGSGAQMNDLNLNSYQSALSGGKSGPGITPGKPDASQVFIMQSKGGHPGQLSDADLEQIKQWILAGAPEK